MTKAQSRIAGLGFFTLAAMLSTGISAQPGCRVDGASIIAELQKDHGEEVKVIAVDIHGNLVRILANDENGSWSMVTTMPARPDGTAPGCLNIHGGYWEIMLPAPRPES